MGLTLLSPKEAQSCLLHFGQTRSNGLFRFPAPSDAISSYTHRRAFQVFRIRLLVTFKPELTPNFKSDFLGTMHPSNMSA
jgi:hypothetical protein